MTDLGRSTDRPTSLRTSTTVTGPARPRWTLILLAGIVVSSAPSPATGQQPGAGAEPGAPPALLVAHRTGAFDARLPSRSAQSDPAAWAQRFQFDGDLGAWDYDLGTQRFSVYVPPAYDRAGEPYGVVVWVSPTRGAAIPSGLRPHFDERRLIWIGAADAGNDRHIYVRAGLALDAAANVVSSYHVDPARVFIAGLSGGGRVAAMEAVVHPEVFAGGLPIIGVTTYLDVPLTSDPGRSVLRFPRPSPGVLDRARAQPFVILTGSDDFNRDECRSTAQAYQRDGFTRLHLLDIDGMGHEMPTAIDFARGLDLLVGPAR